MEYQKLPRGELQKFTPFSFRKNVLKNIPYDAKGCMHPYLLQFDLITNAI